MQNHYGIKMVKITFSSYFIVVCCLPWCSNAWQEVWSIMFIPWDSFFVWFFAWFYFLVCMKCVLYVCMYVCMNAFIVWFIVYLTIKIFFPQNYIINVIQWKWLMFEKLKLEIQPLVPLKAWLLYDMIFVRWGKNPLWGITISMTFFSFIMGLGVKAQSFRLEAISGQESQGAKEENPAALMN